jgi:integrase/recombinase XerD
MGLLKKWMEHKRYSESTIKTYCSVVLVFIRFIKPQAIADTNRNDVIRFVNEYVLAYGFSSSYQNQVINALKLFYREVLKNEIIVEQIERPGREHPLPNVLSQEEVKNILQTRINLKHKCMLSLIYACGLRRSELLNLKPSDVDSNRYILIIRNAKGKKDRIAPLPPVPARLYRVV